MNTKAMSLDTSLPPYNPWTSYLVEASAGSGKTWQLSRRFLALVVAGADPSSILTVTFTRKAAAEMRERIICDAVRLGNGDPEFAGFAESIRKWHPQDLQGQGQSQIRSSVEASRLILEKTQTLKITTIDALFMQWVQQFPLETALTLEGPQNLVSLQSPWDLLSNLAQKRLEQRAWNSVLAMNTDHDGNRDLMQSISIHAPNGSIKQLSRAIAPIMHSNTFLWSVSLTTGQSPAKFHAAPEHVATDEEFIEQQRHLFLEVINLLTNAEKKIKDL
jgi:ATP-dependent exoDNAse (exonuclease V) beta subunit